MRSKAGRHCKLNNLCQGLAVTAMNLETEHEKKNAEVRSDTPPTSPPPTPTTVSATPTPPLLPPTPKSASQLPNTTCSQLNQTTAQTSHTKDYHPTRDPSKRKSQLCRQPASQHFPETILLLIHLLDPESSQSLSTTTILDPHPLSTALSPPIMSCQHTKPQTSSFH
jgi:hypothetical protein